jgi:hypothetical protein
LSSRGFSYANYAPSAIGPGRRLAFIATLTLAVVLVGCGSEDPPEGAPDDRPAQATTEEETTTEEPTTTIATPTEAETTTEQGTSTTAPPKKKRQPRFTGVHAENYRINYFSCGAFSLKDLARQLKVPADPVAIAEEVAGDYRPGYRQAVFEGCLDALLGRKP